MSLSAYAIESMAYMTSAMIDLGEADCSLEAAMCKVSFFLLQGQFAKNDRIIRSGPLFATRRFVSDGETRIFVYFYIYIYQRIITTGNNNETATK